MGQINGLQIFFLSLIIRVPRLKICLPMDLGKYQVYPDVSWEQAEIWIRQILLLSVVVHSESRLKQT